MALDLQITTDSAVSALDKLDKAIGRLRTSTANVSDVTKSLGKINSALSHIGQVPYATISSLSDLASAVRKLDRVTGLTKFKESLTSLNSTSLSGLAATIQNLVNQLSRITVPAGVRVLMTQLNSLARNARTAAAAFDQLQRSMSRLRVPAGALQLPAKLSGVGAAAKTATGGVNALGGAMSVFKGGLAIMGLNAGIAGFRQMGEAALKAADTVNSFTTTMGVFADEGADKAKFAAEQLAFVKKAAFDLALPINTATDSYKNFFAAGKSAGVETDQLKDAFKNVGTALRVMGVDAQGSQRALLAVQQMFTKGKAQAQEVTLQLGQIIPAQADFAKALGVSTKEFQKLMEQGKVGLPEILKYTTFLGEKYGKELPAAMEKGQAAIVNLKNAFTELGEKAGQAFYDAAGKGIRQLTDALHTDAVQQFAASIGSVVGAITNGLSIALTYVIPLLSGFFSGLSAVAQQFGNIVTAVSSVSAYFTGMGSAVQTALNVLGTFAGVAAGLILSANALGLALGLLQPIWNGLTVAGTAFARVLGLITLEMVATTAVISSAILVGATLGVTFYAIKEAFKNGTSVTQELRTAFTGVKTQLTSMIPGFGSLKTNTDKASSSFEELGGDTEGAKEGMRNLKTQAEETNGTLETMKTPADNAAKAMDTLKTAVGTAGTKMSELDVSSGRTSANMGTLAGNFSNSASAANRAATAYDNARRALDQLAASARSAKSAGVSSSVLSSFSGGGISHVGSGRSVSVSSNAFSNAPHFAGGTENTSGYPTVTGGGIPAVLHPNEAVVPLAGGGAIPIAITGGGGGAAGSVVQYAQLATLREMNTQINRVWESIDALSIVVTNEFGKVFQRLDTIIKQFNILIDISDKGFNAIRSGGSLSSTGGGSLGGSSSYGGYSMTGGDFKSDIHDAQTQLAMLQAQYNSAKTQNEMVENGGKFYADYSMSPAGQRDKQALDQFNQGKTQLLYSLFDKYGVKDVVQALYGDKAFEKGSGLFGVQLGSTLYKQLLEGYNAIHDPNGQSFTNYSAPRFAVGSPNASKDVDGSGGFHAILHPNEAVIPLSDGRSVPVTLPDNFNDREFHDPVTSGSRRPVINVKMEITTPDANSFRETQTQITNQLRAELERAARNFGPNSPAPIEDPTKRV